MRVLRRRQAGDWPGGQERAGRNCSLGGAAARGEERERARPCGQLRRRRLGRAVEHRRLVRDGREPERSPPGRRSGRRWWNPGDRPGGEERAGCAGGLVGRASGCEQRERTSARGQQGVRRACLPVEQRRLRRDRGEHEPDDPGRRSGELGRQGVRLPRRDRDPGDRSGGEERAGCGRSVGGAAARGEATRTRPSVWAATAAAVRSSSRTASARRRRLRT